MDKEKLFKREALVYLLAMGGVILVYLMGLHRGIESVQEAEETATPALHIFGVLPKEEASRGQAEDR